MTNKLTSKNFIELTNPVSIYISKSELAPVLEYILYVCRLWNNKPITNGKAIFILHYNRQYDDIYTIFIDKDDKTTWRKIGEKQLHKTSNLCTATREITSSRIIINFSYPFTLGVMNYSTSVQHNEDASNK